MESHTHVFLTLKLYCCIVSNYYDLLWPALCLLWKILIHSYSIICILCLQGIYSHYFNILKAMNRRCYLHFYRSEKWGLMSGTIHGPIHPESSGAETWNHALHRGKPFLWVNMPHCFFGFLPFVHMWMFIKLFPSRFWRSHSLEDTRRWEERSSCQV